MRFLLFCSLLLQNADSISRARKLIHSQFQYCYTFIKIDGSTKLHGGEGELNSETSFTVKAPFTTKLPFVQNVFTSKEFIIFTDLTLTKFIYAINFLSVTFKTYVSNEVQI